MTPQKSLHIPSPTSQAESMLHAWTTLHRSIPQGVANNAGVGATGAEIEGYIGWMRNWIRRTLLETRPIGYADTWTAWILPENRGVANLVAWLGNNIQTESVASGKPVWVTETGWPHVSPDSGATVRNDGANDRTRMTRDCLHDADEMPRLRQG
ncbi:hypothetical protein BKA67DRAFT_664737 [Truncatella angustata]|uniref:Uncharacterized protein n=1 Tax=Truncatella angustata TaxID=152316 RepID=A0A9P8RKH7_9PEZI|nr:uncharacterized protein BKA67DRAFT_664737 [Truncatella angustata]KAH6645721.1 hypothetical protein BKA67DRAFT_664737 [Truncatella angustata]